jgi:hypothetical protein
MLRQASVVPAWQFRAFLLGAEAIAESCGTSTDPDEDEA